VEKLRKIKALAKYEIINLRRGKLIWVIGALYIFGIQQVIDSMKLSGNTYLSLVGLIKISWLPLNFIMIPLLLLIVTIGQSSNEVFESLDISRKEIIVSKLITIGIINVVLLLCNLVILAFFCIISGASVGYILYECTGYIINTFIFLIVCGSIGLFIGQVINKYVYDIIGYIIVILLFGFLCNFYKLENTIFPLVDIRTFPGIFDAISYDKSYLYHNILWLGISLILILGSYMFICNRKNELGNIRLQIVSIIIVSILCVYLGVSINAMKPNIYDIRNRQDAESEDIKNINRERTYFSKNDCGYYIDKYNMNIDINNNIKNSCEMEIRVINKSVSSIEIGLYKSLNISKLEVDGKKAEFERTNNSFIAKLSREYRSGEIVNMKISYEGAINTQWINGRSLFFARNNSLFLADVLEWYPKLNDDEEKDYKINIKYASKNKVYTNLDQESNQDGVTFSGKDRDIFLVSGNVADRKYKDYLVIGNEEYIKSDKECDELIDYLNRTKNPTKKIVLSPFIPGLTKMDKPYEGAFIWASDY
jgi:hypothetical protein